MSNNRNSYVIGHTIPYATTGSTYCSGTSQICAPQPWLLSGITVQRRGDCEQYHLTCCHHESVGRPRAFSRNTLWSYL